MTKAELIKALEAFPDDIEIVVDAFELAGYSKINFVGATKVVPPDPELTSDRDYDFYKPWEDVEPINVVAIRQDSLCDDY